DGWPDLYVANDMGPDDLYLNLQGKKFLRVQGRDFGNIGLDSYKGMDSSLADFARTGFLDIYVSNVHEPLHAEGSMLWMTRPTRDPFLPTFRDEATTRGALNEHRWGWGAAVDDVDNDGWIDIVQANGMFDCRLERTNGTCPEWWYQNSKLIQAPTSIRSYADMWGDMRGRSIYPSQARRLYLNRGDRPGPEFVDVADLAGIADPDNSRGVALVDLDNDGALDLVVTNQMRSPEIYRNTLYDADRPGPKPHWLGLQLVGDGTTCNRQAIGTQVELHYTQDGKPVRQLREVQAVNGFAAQPDPRLHFGLGRYRGPVTASISWCGRPARPYTGLATDRYLVIQQD
ncbi:MAG: VCBS repeat-containing protein, partial [Nevskia sp.]|nr:VCBS repeat-containing protein [Nevskia sp.]